jgi:hypothetical protein
MSHRRPSRPRATRGADTTAPRRTASPPRSRPAASHPSPRRRRGVIIGAGLAVLALVIVVVALVGGTAATPSPAATSVSAATNGPLGPEGIPLETGAPLAPASTSATGSTVDGVQCDSSEQVAYHVHTHLAIYVDGKARALPAGVGIVEPVAESTTAGPFDQASRCYYWLHVHARDGVIHIESPTAATYTLGQFFDIWGQPLGADQVGPDTGVLTTYVDGKRFDGDPRAITFGSHVDIQIDVGAPAPPPKSVDWSRSEL